jgi:hypothetical protein
MDLLLSKQELKTLEKAQDIVEEWRSILNIDPIWDIQVRVLFRSDMAGRRAFINLTRASKYIADIVIDYGLLAQEDFIIEMEEIAAHELLHVVTEDFMRTAILAAGNNKKLAEELRHKCEQLINRLEKSVWDLSFEEE